MFEQHPVPQQISSYQFRLVGDMTLKQFFQLAGGAVVALIIYSLPLPGFLKWPAVVISALSGAAFAFLPIQDRPLEQWLAAFFKAIYAPTMYVWARPATPPQYFKPAGTPGAPSIPAPTPQQVAQADKDIDPEYVKNLDKDEEEMLAKIQGLMAGHSPKPAAPEPEPVKEAPEPTPGESLIKTETVTEAPPQAPTEQKPEHAPVIVPRAEEVKMEEHKGFEAPHETREVAQTEVKQVLSTSQTGEVQKAEFSVDAAPPTPPTQANILVGQVMDNQGKIIEGAILEIKDKQGRPVRALKTNRAGHFMIVTPLPDGVYDIITEKEGFTFNPIEIETKGEIIGPIAIRAK